jgi:hypothetical protein
MKFLEEKINGCRVIGKDVKDLIFYPSGVLVYKKHHLIFVSSKDNGIRSLWLREEALYPVVFVLSDFDEVDKIIEGEREYVLEINGNFLFLRDRIVGEPKIEITGQSY